MIRSLTDERGTISWTEDPRWCRAYWLTKNQPNAVRGEHAHRNTARLFVCLKGAVTGLAQAKAAKASEFELNARVIDLTEGKAFLSPPMEWTRVHLFGDAILLVLADKPYDRSEMIFDFEEWKKEVAK